MRNYDLGPSFKKRGLDAAHKKAEEMEVFMGLDAAINQAYVYQNVHTNGSNSHQYWLQVYWTLFNKRRALNDPGTG